MGVAKQMQTNWQEWRIWPAVDLWSSDATFWGSKRSKFRRAYCACAVHM